jgi:hypothetical protein
MKRRHKNFFGTVRYKGNGGKAIQEKAILVRGHGGP